MRRYLAIFAAVAVGLGVTVWGLQRRLIYLPAGAPPPIEQVLPGASEVTVTTEDGLTLGVWYLDAGPVAVLVLPGNAGNRANRAPLARALAERGFSVLLMDYRGYGGNPGRPSEPSLTVDARAGFAWLEQQQAVEHIVVFGESIGAAVAVQLATDTAPAALILRSPFTTLAEAARANGLPVPKWVLRDRFPSVELIDDVSVPVLVIAGEADRIVPIQLSRALFDAAHEPKRFVAVPGAGHNDAALLDGPRLLEAVSSFLHDHDLRVHDP